MSNMVPKEEATIPLSLQDMCVLNIILRWDEFPLQVLSDLPLKIRRNLTHSLPLVDVLNLEGTPMSKGVDLDSKDIRENMVNSLFSNYSIEGFLCTRFFIEDGHRYTPDCLVDHIASCYPSLESTVIKRKYTNSLLFPSRSLQYVSIVGKESVDLVPSSLEHLLHYSKLIPTKQVKIDCCNFAHSVIWRDYLGLVAGEHRLSPEGSTSESSDEVEYRAISLKKRQPNVYHARTLPYLQHFLSRIETLELGCSSTSGQTSEPDLKETVQAVSHVILHNIVTSNQPCLKHLEIFGMPNATSWILGEVTKPLCESSCEKGISPYLLESVSLLPYTGSEYSKLSDVASDIASNISTIVAFQMHNLKHVTVHHLGSHYDRLEHDWDSLSDRMIRQIRRQRRANFQEYKQLLSLLVRYVKQSQMQSLDIDECPSPEAYQLIEAFLCTSTSIEQQLTIWVVDESDHEKPKATKWAENKEKKEQAQVDFHDLIKDTGLIPPISQPIPESSTQFKCLDMHIMSHSHSFAWLLNLPELKLKRLSFSAHYLPLVSPHIDVQVQHITFNFFGELFGFCNTEIFPNHLEKFITSNQALKSLVIVNPTSESDPWGSRIYPALNHCLSTLCRQGRKLDEIHMKSVDFCCSDPRDFFTIVRDLSQKCGTTLVLSPNTYVFFSEEHVNSLLPALSNEFQGKKIKKVVVTRNPNILCFDLILSQLQMIADEVIAI